MKKLLAMTLALTLVLGMTAFAGAEDSLEAWGAKIKEQYDGKTVTVALAAHPASEAYKTMGDAFTALTGVKIVWDVIEETNLKSKQLLDFLGAGNYDVFMVDAFWMSEYASKEVLIPVEDFVNNAGITPAFFDYNDIMAAFRNGIAGSGGVNYGIPIAGETRFVGYRTDLFEKYGKTPPKTMDEYLELARFFNGKEEGLYGVAMRAQRGIHFASGWMSLMYNFGGGFVDQQALAKGEDVVTCDTPETIASLQFYVDLMKNAPADATSYTHEEALSLFLSGKAAMWLDATTLAGQITNPQTSKVWDKVAFVPTPTGPKGDGAALAGWNLGIPKSSKQQELGWAFIVYMCGKATSAEYVSKSGAAMRESDLSNPDLVAVNPSFPSQIEALKSANGLVEKGLAWIPPHDQINQILEVAGSWGSSALAGDITVEAAIAGMQAEIEDLLGL